MENITSTAELKNAIQRLEAGQAVEGQLLKEDLNIFIDSFKPINLLKSAFSDITTSPHLIDNIVSTAVGLGTGYLSRVLVVGGSGNLIKKLLGIVLQLGVTSSVAQNPGTVKALGHYIFQNIFHRKDKNNSEYR